MADRNADRMNIGTKVAYVKAQSQTRNHHCHWPGCTRQVPPALWGCKSHWFALPQGIRDAIWSTFKPGQEVTARPSREYVAAAQAAQDWIASKVQRDIDPAKMAPKQPTLF